MIEAKETMLKALRKGGLDVLKDVEKFRKYVLEELKVTSGQKKMLTLACDDTFLGIFSKAVDSQASFELSNASVNAAQYLSEEYAVDPAVAGTLADDIAAACADLCGIVYTQMRGPSGGAEVRARPSGKLLGASKAAVVAMFSTVVVAMACFLAYAHFNPILGCTLLPSHHRVNDVKCAAYETQLENPGHQGSIVFVENASPGPVRIAVKNDSLTGLQNQSWDISRTISLEKGDRGILFASGGAGAYDIVTDDLSRNDAYLVGRKYLSKNLRWRVGVDGSGSATIELINNATDPATSELGGSIMLVKRGLFVSVKYGLIKGEVKPGVNSYLVSSMSDEFYIGKPLEAKDANEVYVNGVLIPHE